MAFANTGHVVAFDSLSPFYNEKQQALAITTTYLAN